MHSFVNKIFSREIHLPSAEKLWQIPALIQFPIPVPSFCLSLPLDVHATSYLAASDKILNFSAIVIFSVILITFLLSNVCSALLYYHIEHTFAIVISFRIKKEQHTTLTVVNCSFSILFLNILYCYTFWSALCYKCRPKIQYLNLYICKHFF